MFRAVIASIVMAAGFATFTATPSTANAGPIGGLPESATFDVASGYEDTLSIGLKGGESTYISITGNGASTLELRVYNEAGTLVASDTFGSGDSRKVTFTPPTAGKYKIKVANPGQASNTYKVLVW